MTNAERLRRLARAEGLPETAPASGAELAVNLDYVFDPVWLRHMLTLPGAVLMDGDTLVMAHLTGGMKVERYRCASRRAHDHRLSGQSANPTIASSASSTARSSSG